MRLVCVDQSTQDVESCWVVQVAQGRQDHVVASSGRRNEALKRADELPLKQRSDVLLFSRKMHKEELEAMAAAP